MIREMTDGDVEAVTRLIGQLHADQPGAVVPSKVRQGWKAFVAEGDGGEPIGFLLGTFTDYGLAHESAGTLEQLVVDEGARGSGIGRQLVDQWKQWLRDEGITLAFLSADPDAVPFYVSCGFRPTTGPWLVWAAEET